MKKLNEKVIKKKELKIMILTHKLVAFILSYLILAPGYTNPSNLSSQTPPISSLIIFCLSSHY
jgi:hypothetical protein